MNIQVVTDSTADLPPELAAELGIRVVPIYVRFGNEAYRDGEDIRSEELYRRLTTSPIHPATSQPTPEDFAAVYEEYCGRADGIISVHISSRISGTCNSAVVAQEMLKGRCPVEVIDSGFNSGGLALATLAAARLAKAGESLAEIAAGTRRALGQISMLGFFRTVKYLARGGRASKVIVAAASILKVMPLLTFHQGDIVRAGLVRSVAQGMERLYNFAAGKREVAEMVIAHSAVPELAEQLKQRLGGLFPEERIRIMKLGAGLGVHGGPGVLLVALREGV